MIAADRGLCGAYNSSVIRAAERRVAEHQALGRDYALVARRPEGRGLLPLPRLPHRRARSPASRDTPDLRGRPRRSAAPSPRRSSPARSTSSRSSTRGSSPPARRWSCRQTLMPLDRASDILPSDRRRRGAERAPAYEFEPSAEGDPRPAPAALRRVAHVRRAAQRGRVGARGPPAGDEGRHRQRRRPHHHPQPES